jgi:outer membrane murein-binding lipoprotein Lpp
VFTPVLANHTKKLSLVDILAVGVDRMQRDLEPMRKQIEAGKGTAACC